MKTAILLTTMSLFTQMVNANEIPAIDSASNTMNIAALQSLSQQTQGYELAYANYRLAITANILGQRTLAKSALSTAQSTLEELDDSEALALLASVYGMQIGIDNIRGASLGPKQSQALTQAEALSPSNPRVALVKAISAFNTPVAFGGSMKNAIELSSRAIALYGEPCHEVCWGHAEAYTWRGLAKQNSGDTQGALADWQSAIKIQPDYSWANFLLKQNNLTH
ncbi:tetratricopeptide repeat protein [uncultured Shewanella sp.]|uniref:tetratricopeptide repeat protein n=1 Tax=uncultured Shewanella sp. TaxID=173975 RepID=UPI00260E09C7|nr:tetratricopeptide repeat protein [uncultured Shewanella sp.]